MKALFKSLANKLTPSAKPQENKELEPVGNDLPLGRKNLNERKNADLPHSTTIRPNFLRGR